MRDLKFRYFLFIDKGFVYWDLKKSNEQSPDTHGYAGGMAEPQQYTGLKDKYGREIYEGDIVKVTYDGGVSSDGVITGTIQYEAPCYEVADEDGSTYNFYNYVTSEILGNFHQNPELLKNPKT
jgi:hypothetical protein